MKVCVLGAGGLLGHMLVRVLGQTNSVYGTTRDAANASSPLAKFLPQEKWIGGVDAAQDGSIQKIFSAEQFDVLINCIGLIKQRNAHVSDREMMQINGEFPHQLTQVANSHATRVIQISTDCVFSGNRGNYQESDVPDPIDIYGESKFRGEVNDSFNLTLRTSHVGRELFVKRSFVEWVLAQKGQQVNGYSHAIYSGLTTRELAMVISKLVQSDSVLTGLFHVSSRPISKLEIIRKLNELLDLRITLIADPSVKVDRSLNSEKFQKSTGIILNSWDKMLLDFCKDQHTYE